MSSVYITCEYCNNNIHIKNKSRHEKSKKCVDNRTNAYISIVYYSCKYCNKQFNLLDNKNTHEINCKFKDIYNKLQLELKDKDNELKDKDIEIIELKNNKDIELKDKDIEINDLKKNKDIELKDKDIEINDLKNIKDIEIIELKKYNDLILYEQQMNRNYINEQKKILVDLRNQIYTLQLNKQEIHNHNNIQINININFNEIKDHLDKYTIETLTNQNDIISYIYDIYKNKLVLLNDKRKIIGYYNNNENIKDNKCRNFLKNCAKQLSEPNDILCKIYYDILDKKKMREAHHNQQMTEDMIDSKRFSKTITGKKFQDYIINELKKRDM